MTAWSSSKRPTVADAPHTPVLVAITPERPVADEAAKVTALLDGGFHTVHLRHPSEGIELMRELLDAIPLRLHPQLHLHDHHELVREYDVGLHFNSRHPLPPGFSGSASMSCHSIAEVHAVVDRLDYVTLSPIYSSISKPGYMAAFTPDESLRRAIAGHRVVALGGVTPDRLPQLRACGFYGAAMLGAIPWDAPTAAFINTIQTLQICFNS